MKSKTLVKGIIIGAVIAGAAGVGWHFYNESRKSEVEKAAGKSAKWASDTTDKVAEKTKSLFK